jgi:methylenetetrahydrofolate reductase (NADPH)
MTFYPAGKFSLSFELFPPKSAATEAAMYDNVEHLMAFKPDIITCTYGAGGSTQQKTLEVTSEVKRRFGVRVASHLTCVGSTVDQLRSYLREAGSRGVDNIVALRGDPPKGQTEFQAVAGGLRYANELLALVKSEFPSYGVAVAGYPETHQEAPSFEVDLQNLQRKVAAGADCIITQLFYDNADFFRFRDACEQLGIRVPIIPGILPVTNLGQIQRITSLCKAKLPESFIAKLSDKDDADWQFQVGVEYATQQVQELVDRGIPGVHFYVLNKSPATTAVLQAVKMPA